MKYSKEYSDDCDCDCFILDDIDVDDDDNTTGEDNNDNDNKNCDDYIVTESELGGNNLVTRIA